MSTPLAVAWVAGGRRAGYVSDGLSVENVHYTAGIALCHSAGCVVTASLGSRWKTVAASSSPRAMTDAAETKRRAGVSSA